MAIVLPFDMNPPEMRVLQEFRRLATETLPLATINAVRHPAPPGASPALGLEAKGYLTADGSKQTFALTQKGRDFLSLEAKPMFEEATAGAASDDDGEH